MREVLVENEHSPVERCFLTIPALAFWTSEKISAASLCVWLHVIQLYRAASAETADDTFQLIEVNKLENESLSRDALNQEVWRDDGLLMLKR